MFRKLIAAIRRFFSRRTARKLLAQQLPRGLPAPQGPFRLALRVPRVLEPPPGEFWTVPLGAQVVGGQKPSRLLRLAALPPPPRRLDVIRALAEPAPLFRAPLAPELLRLPEPLESPVRNLGIARPAHFRLDGEFRLPPEVDPLRISSDAPSPTPVRRVRPRTPLPRAPVWRLRPRNFRVDAETLQPANEGIVPLERRDTTFRWVRPAFRSQYLDLPWMAQERIAFLTPFQTEWFAMWWFLTARRSHGAKKQPVWRIPKELGWWIERVKEQMLIRRDVKKDEQPPPAPKLRARPIGLQIASFESERKLSSLVPEKEWVEPFRMAPAREFETGTREAYLQWRTLMDALGER